MLKNKRILFVILMAILMILIPSVVKAEKKDLSKIEISVPTPVVGETPALYSEASVIADDNIMLEPFEITWFKWSENDKDYTIMMLDPTEKFTGTDKYAVKIGYKRPENYKVSNLEGYILDDFRLYFNGIELDATSIENFNPGSSGEMLENGQVMEWDFVYFEFGVANKAKYISKIDITIPEPEIGKMQCGPEAFSVRVDENEILEVVLVLWEKYDSQNECWGTEAFIPIDEVKGNYSEDFLNETKAKEFKENEKYRAFVIYRRSWDYGYSENLIAKINGKIVNVNDTFGFDKKFPTSLSEEVDYGWDEVIFEFPELKKYEPVENPDKENDKQQNLENDAEEKKEDVKKEESKKEEVKKEETKKDDATKAGGTIPYAGGEIIVILSAIAIIGLGIYLYRKNKDLRGV